MPWAQSIFSYSWKVVDPLIQATSGAGRMVKSKSMEVMKAVQEDLGEVKTTISTYTAPVKGAGGAIMNSVKVRN